MRKVMKVFVVLFCGLFLFGGCTQKKNNETITDIPEKPIVSIKPKQTEDVVSTDIVSSDIIKNVPSEYNVITTDDIISEKWYVQLNEEGEPDYFGILYFEDENKVWLETGSNFLDDNSFDKSYYGYYKIVKEKNHKRGYKPGTLIFDLELFCSNAESSNGDLRESIKGVYLADMHHFNFFDLYLIEGDELFGSNILTKNSYNFSKIISEFYGYNVVSEIDEKDKDFAKSLIGSWNCYVPGELTCYLSITSELRFVLSFAYTENGAFFDISETGKIDFIRFEENNDFEPNFILLEFDSGDVQQVAVYNYTYHKDKILLALLCYETVFDYLDYMGTGEAPPLVVLEKDAEKNTGNQKSKIQKNSYIPAIFWDVDFENKIVWVDDMEWGEDSNPDTNNVHETIAYKATDEALEAVRSWGMFPGWECEIET